MPFVHPNRLNIIIRSIENPKKVRWWHLMMLLLPYGLFYFEGPDRVPPRLSWSLPRGLHFRKRFSSIWSSVWSSPTKRPWEDKYPSQTSKLTKIINRLNHPQRPLGKCSEDHIYKLLTYYIQLRFHREYFSFTFKKRNESISGAGGEVVILVTLQCWIWATWLLFGTFLAGCN